MKRTAADRPGVTLLEGVMALSVIGLVSLATLEGFAAQLRGAATARAALRRFTLAERRMIMLQLLPGPELAKLPDSLGTGSGMEAGVPYRWRASTATILGEPGLYHLHIEVDAEHGRVALDSRIFRPEREGKR